MAKSYQSRVDRRRYYKQLKLKRRLTKLSQRFPVIINPYRWGESELRFMTF